MNINYNYSIINVDHNAKSMEIVYDSPQYGVLHVGARLPWEGETVEDIVRMYNPVAYWIEQGRAPIEVVEGACGSQTIDFPDPDAPPPPPTPEDIRLARQIAYQQEADPLYFQWQRGEATEQQWLDKIAEIREWFPYDPELEYEVED